MNSSEHSTGADGKPAGMQNTARDKSDPAEDLFTARAFVLTVWLAMKSQDFEENGGADALFLAGTLYEAFERISRAQRTLEALS